MGVSFIAAFDSTNRLGNTKPGACELYIHSRHITTQGSSDTWWLPCAPYKNCRRWVKNATYSQLFVVEKFAKLWGNIVGPLQLKSLFPFIYTTACFVPKIFVLTCSRWRHLFVIYQYPLYSTSQIETVIHLWMFLVFCPYCFSNSFTSSS